MKYRNVNPKWQPKSFFKEVNTIAHYKLNPGLEPTQALDVGATWPDLTRTILSAET